MIVSMGAKTAKVRHPVAILAYDGLSLFEFSAAYEVFRGDPDGGAGSEHYDVRVCGAEDKFVRLDNGLRLEVRDGLASVSRADIVVVPPTDDLDGVPESVLQALRRAHARGARLVSLCTGVFVLAAAGLLDGRRVTTHWGHCAELAAQYPTLTVDPDVLYVDDGDILTSAGSAASIDLCLHIVRRDLGAGAAAVIARDLVVPPYRDGGQAQYIQAPLPADECCDLFADTMTWMQAHLDEPLSVDELARRSAMSRRTFARRFTAATGTTPYRWLTRQRLIGAQQLLEASDLPIEAVARSTGFVNAANLRKHFGRALRTTPHAYRRTFQAREPA
jgi:transcriptional regulator GlxA family with amidase domain